MEEQARHSPHQNEVCPQLMRNDSNRSWQSCRIYRLHRFAEFRCFTSVKNVFATVPSESWQSRNARMITAWHAVSSLAICLVHECRSETADDHERCNAQAFPHITLQVTAAKTTSISHSKKPPSTPTVVSLSDLRSPKSLLPA